MIAGDKLRKHIYIYIYISMNTHKYAIAHPKTCGNRSFPKSNDQRMHHVPKDTFGSTLSCGISTCRTCKDNCHCPACAQQLSKLLQPWDAAICRLPSYNLTLLSMENHPEVNQRKIVVFHGYVTPPSNYRRMTTCFLNRHTW